jgi:hypothetical protein
VGFIERFSCDLKRWSLEGLSELDDPKSPYELDYYTRTIVNLPGYLDNPVQTASNYSGYNPNDCAALLRVLPAALMPTAPAAERLAVLACRVTHKSPSVTACGCLIALVLQGILFQSPDMEHVVVYACSRLESLVRGVQRGAIYKAASDPELRDVGGRDYGGRHIASLRCFMYALRRILSASGGANSATPDADGPPGQQADDAGAGAVSPPGKQADDSVGGNQGPPDELWEETMYEICREGGAADVNAALAGAALGARYGLAIVPAWRADLPHAKWLGELIGRTAGP